MRTCFARFFCMVLVAIVLSGCGHFGDYMGLWESKLELKHAFQKEPSARLLNQLNPEGSFLVHGRISFNKQHKGPILVVAVSDAYKTREIVSALTINAPVEYYESYLPEGRYDLYFLADLDGNGYYESSEIVGMTSKMPIHISKDSISDGLTIPGPTFILDLQNPVKADLPIKIPVKEFTYIYPSLDDPFFDPKYGRMGLYDTKSMLAHIQRFFFSLEKFDPEKTLVLFVHGADGTPRDFKFFVEGLDRSRYQPWFYYYPSGMPLKKLGSLLALVIKNASDSHNFKQKRIIVVAHSMGGLVSLSGLDELCADGKPSYLKGYISFDSPYGGVPAMPASVQKALVVIPSWLDLLPGSSFLERLHSDRARQNFPFYLFFGYKNGDSGDGTITLQSQLESKVHLSADKSYGFMATHVGILNDDAVRQQFYRVLDKME